MRDIVRTITYVTDIRNFATNRTCRQEVFGVGPSPPQTFLVVSALARQGMLVEIEVTAVAPQQPGANDLGPILISSAVS